MGGVTRETQKLDMKDHDVILQAIGEVRGDLMETDWMLLVFEENAFVFSGKGSGGIKELQETLKTTSVNYALLRYTEQIDASITVKFCLIKFQPENIRPSVRGKLGLLAGAVSALFEPVHKTIFVTDPSEMAENF